MKLINLIASIVLYVLTVVLVMPLRKALPGESDVWLFPVLFIGASAITWLWAEIWMPFCLQYWEKRGAFTFITANKQTARFFFRVIFFGVNSLLLAFIVSVYAYYFSHNYSLIGCFKV